MIFITRVGDGFRRPTAGSQKYTLPLLLCRQKSERILKKIRNGTRRKDNNLEESATQALMRQGGGKGPGGRDQGRRCYRRESCVQGGVMIDKVSTNTSQMLSLLSLLTMLSICRSVVALEKDATNPRTTSLSIAIIIFWPFSVVVVVVPARRQLRRRPIIIFRLHTRMAEQVRQHPLGPSMLDLHLLLQHLHHLLMANVSAVAPCLS